MDRTVIPKDCAVCDSCNIALTDSEFIATEYSFWYEGWLYCDNCHKKYKPAKDQKLIMEIQKGQDLSKTELAKPIVLEFGNKDEFDKE